jgi:prevent-host-death family protein
MDLKNKVKPITYLKNHTAELVREISEEGGGVLITQNGEAKIVMIDVETYERWRKAMSLLKVLAQSEGDVAAGKTVSQEEAFQRAEATINMVLKGE